VEAAVGGSGAQAPAVADGPADVAAEDEGAPEVAAEAGTDPGADEGAADAGAVPLDEAAEADGAEVAVGLLAQAPAMITTADSAIRSLLVRTNFPQSERDGRIGGGTRTDGIRRDATF